MNQPFLSLYYYDSCPFCIRVLRQLPPLEDKGLKVELRNTMVHRHHAQELVQGGGRRMVPCLLIENDGQQQWLYESMDIIKYLQSLD